ncbi:MAG: helix-turn-helix domain-containing protein [Chthoniobacterales bacterium]
MNPQVSQELKNVRESKGLSVEQVARDLCLRTDVLRELEDADQERSLPDIYRKLSLRMYARYLGVDFKVSRDENSIELSPVDGCVELAYSEKSKDEKEPKKRGGVGPGTILAASTVLILTVGLWSLNAKISRLNFDEKQPRTIAAAAEVPVSLAAPSTMNETLRLEDSVFLTLTPPEPDATAATDAP